MRFFLLMMQHKLCTISAIVLAAGLVTTCRANQNPDQSADLAKSLGISFPSDSRNTAILSRDGKEYIIDVAAKTVRPAGTSSSAGTGQTAGASGPAAGIFAQNCVQCHGPDGKGIKAVGTPNFTDPAFRNVSEDEIRNTIRNGKGAMPPWGGKLREEQISELVTYVRSFSSGQGAGTSSSTQGPTQASTPAAQAQTPSNIYQAGDDVLVSLPTGRATDRHGVYVNFSHRFAYDAAFTGMARGAQLFGLDGVAIPSLGVRYGVTDKLSVSLYRSPSLISRPIQLMAGYNLLEERKGDPLNLMMRVSIEGQDNFRKNYTENIEAILSRSITKKAQFYFVPTASFNDRRLVQPSGFLSNQIPDLPGINAFSLGFGLTYDIRPTVALMAEVIPTVANANELGIHRPAFSFGIQKKIWRHAFTLGLTNSPGTTVSQRAGTRATFLGDPSADTFGGLVFGFNITRQIH
jgi:mono/diheme cytochrome c family protein